MGVEGLWKVLDSAKQATTLESLSGKVLAVDVSLWIHQAIRGCAGGKSERNAHLKVLFFRICKLLFYGIRPIFVFDGPNIPYFKQITLSKRRLRRAESAQRANKIQKKMLKKLAELVNCNKLPKENRKKHDLNNNQQEFENDNGEKLDTQKPTPAQEMLISSESEDDQDFIDDQLDSSIDIESEEFQALPPDLQCDIVLDKRYQARYHAKFLPENSNDFSDFQLNNLLSKNKLNRKLDEIRQKAFMSDRELLHQPSEKFKIKTAYHGATRSHLLLEIEKSPVDAADQDQSQPCCSQTISKTVNEDDCSEKPCGSKIQQHYDEHENEIADSQQFDASDISQSQSSEIQIQNDRVEFPSNTKMESLASDVILIPSSNQSQELQYEQHESPKDIRQPDCSQVQKQLQLQAACSKIPAASVQAASGYGNSQVCCHDSSATNFNTATASSNTNENEDDDDDESFVEVKDNDVIKIVINLPHESPDDLLSNVDDAISQNEVEQQDESNDDEDSNAAESFDELKSLKRKAEAADRSMTSEISQECMTLIRLFKLPIVQSPGEAEAQCTQLEQLAICQGTITDDSDVWLFGAKTVYRHVFNKKHYVAKYESQKINEKLGLSKEKLIKLAMLSGCDYTVGLKGVGVVTGLEILSEFKDQNDPESSLDDLKRFRLWYENYSKITAPPENSLRSRLINMDLKFPDSFPDQSIFDAFIKPNVESDQSLLDNIKFDSSIKQTPSLRNYARQQFAWSDEKITELLTPALKKYDQLCKSGKLSGQMSIKNFTFRLADEQPMKIDGISNSRRLNRALKKLKDSKEKVPSMVDDNDEQKTMKRRRKIKK